METRANFILIGAFTLGAVVAAFLFIMWIVNYGATGTHRRYQVIFNGSVTGLSAGSTVRFNGLKVGEVTNLGFVKGNPSQVVADLDVTNPSAPINADTKAQLETTGLTGAAVVALIGGERGGELTGNPPVIPSLPTATLADLQTKAGYVLDLANKLLVDNAQPIHQTIENVQTFSMALAHNSSDLDAALKGVADLGKTLEPLAARLQALSDDADNLVKAVDSGKIRAIVDNVQAMSGKADAVLDRADKLLADNSGAINSTMANVSAFSKTLNDNRANVDATLQGFADLGKQVKPLGQRLQSLSDDADKLVKAVDAEKVRAIVDNVQAVSGKADSMLNRADKLLADNSGAINSTMANVSAFSKTLNDNRANIDATLQGFADLGKQIEPLGQRLQSLSDDADKVVKAIDAEKVRAIVDDAQVFGKSLAASGGNFETVMRDGAAFVSKLNDTSKQLDAAIADIDNIVKAVDPSKVSGIVDKASGIANSLGDVADTVRANRGNIDQTIKNATEMMAKLNASADKVDGLMTSLQGFVGAPGTKGALQQVSDAAQSIKKLADDVDLRVKEISVGLNRFSNSGLRQYEALAIQGQRVLEDIDQTVRSFKQNPSQLIWGARSSLPEYRAGQ
jgi:phospholipid/cholesterol/gamma-HCH transport system substrate-binding protein